MLIFVNVSLDQFLLEGKNIMNKHKKWQCPYCGNSFKLISDKNYNTKLHTLNIDVTEKYKQLKTAKCAYNIEVEGVTCPNPQCEELTLTAKLFVKQDVYIELDFGDRELVDTNNIEINRWQIMPQGSCKTFPDYIKKEILEDYREACAIKNLSPKASATLARRCLQGMVRDFFNIEDEKTLYDELSEIKDKVDKDLWGPINKIREYGNIAAHPTKENVNTILDIDEGEVDDLIWLIELLFDEWYVKRHEKDKKLKEIENMGKSKTNQPKSDSPDRA